MSDVFEVYLKCKNATYRQTALTANSYKNVDHNVPDSDVNNEMATYGDALLKLALCQILFEENVKNITEEKKNYESDDVLVRVVAEKYSLIQYIRFDRGNKNIPQNYNYEKKGDDSPHKYIATAVEALLAAIYLDHNKDFDFVVDIVRKWKMLIDERSAKKE